MAVPERTAQNVAPLKQYTKAEQAFFDRWEAHSDDLTANGSADAREAAIGGLKLYGLPTRRVEGWHYTDLRAKLLDLDFPEASNDASPVQPLVQVKEGVKAVGFNASKFSPDRVELGFQGSDDTVGQINAAFADDGLNCTIDAHASFDVPLEYATVVNGGQ
ncbi:MAG: hypothetical protein AAF737_07325 [Pseudomonadota bacterium]